MLLEGFQPFRAEDSRERGVCARAPRGASMGALASARQTPSPPAPILEHGTSTFNRVGVAFAVKFVLKNKVMVSVGST